MFDLEKILDDVRNKYYSSKLLERPTISWSEDYWTDYYGQYTFFDNHITISRALNDERVSEDMLASVIYHENLHQDFQEHDRKFKNKEKLYPGFYELKKELDDLIPTLRAELEYPMGYNSFLKDKQRIVYIQLNKHEDYPEAFYNWNDKILVDFNSNVDFETNDKDFYVFVVKNEENYHIVGWCVNGILKNKRIKVSAKKFDDEDFSYQLESSFDDTFVIPLTCCDYTIPRSDMPERFETRKCCVYDIAEPLIKQDIDYIETYCEGYYKVGMDVRNIDCIPPFLSSVTTKDMRTQKRRSYADVWLKNAIYDREPTYENLVERATAKYMAGMIEFAFDDFLKANSLNPNESDIAYDIIKMAVLLKKFDVANEFMIKYKNSLPNDDKILKNLYNEIQNNQ